mgnify:CR=1 FL=1
MHNLNLETELTIAGTPMATQSMKVARFGKHIRKYQPAKVTNWQAYVKTYVLTQLPEDWKPLDCGLYVEYVFVFPILKSMSKKQKQFIKDGGILYKATRPDLGDNLRKGLNDALSGIVWTDDSRIVSDRGKKIYGEFPRIDIKVYSGVNYR